MLSQNFVERGGVGKGGKDILCEIESDYRGKKMGVPTDFKGQ